MYNFSQWIDFAWRPENADEARRHAQAAAAGDEEMGVFLADAAAFVQGLAGRGGGLGESRLAFDGLADAGHQAVQPLAHIGRDRRPEAAGEPADPFVGFGQRSRAEKHLGG